MFERELTLFKFMLGYGRMLLADVTEEQMGIQPTRGANPPVWHLGHLAVVHDATCQQLGGELQCPKKWFVLFGRGSEPREDTSKYPDKQTLIETYEAGHQRLCELVQQVSSERAGEPNPMEELRGPLPTLGDLLGHSMTTHIAMHMGQIAAWRNAMGLPRVF